MQLRTACQVTITALAPLNYQEIDMFEALVKTVIVAVVTKLAEEAIKAVQE
jgi:hypothetical protein